MKSTYIYQLDHKKHEELCRILDSDDDWMKLAGYFMKYSPFEIEALRRYLFKILPGSRFGFGKTTGHTNLARQLEETAQQANRRLMSPSQLLFAKWGQLNHTVEELFLLLYKMEHYQAMRCLVPIVDEKLQQLWERKAKSKSLSKEKNTISKEKDTKAVGDYHSPKLQKEFVTSSSIPLPAINFELGIEPSTSSRNIAVHSTHEASSGNSTSTTTNTKSLSMGVNSDIIKSVTAIPVIKYEELSEATNNWSEANLLGAGGFGQVFKGEWKLLTVAVKRLKETDAKHRELISEMCLNQYRHDNILPLYGYSFKGPVACLVYQYMNGGSLEQRLRLKTQHPPLSWSQRLRIVHGVARGLLFLHTMTRTPLIHGDIKPANILLDQCSIPKIGDFGLARKGPFGEDRSHVKVSKIHGTRPYLPEEYLRSRFLSPAVDVFSFGVVMIETATSLRSMDKSRSAPLLSDHIHELHAQKVDFSQLEDANLKGTPKSNPELCNTFINIGLDCTHSQRQARPTMMKVYRHIDSINVPNIEYVPI